MIERERLAQLKKAPIHLIYNSENQVIGNSQEFVHEVERLKGLIDKLKVHGTDGCRGRNDTCTGRITLYYTDKFCLECQARGEK